MKFRTEQEAAEFLRDGIAQDYLHFWDAKTFIEAITKLPPTEEFHLLKRNSLFYSLPPSLRKNGQTREQAT